MIADIFVFDQYNNLITTMLENNFFDVKFGMLLESHFAKKNTNGGSGGAVVLPQIVRSFSSVFKFFAVAAATARA